MDKDNLIVVTRSSVKREACMAIINLFKWKLFKSYSYSKDYYLSSSVLDNLSFKKQFCTWKSSTNINIECILKV